MKRILFSFIVFVFSTTSFSQSYGGSTFLFDSGWSSLGYGISVEYNHNLSSNLDLSVQPSFLYNSNKLVYGKLQYINLPLLVGVRYYFLNTTFKPYLSADVIGSYFIHEFFLIDSFSRSTKRTEDGFYFGGSASAGTLIQIAEQWHLNFNIRIGIISNRSADFISYNLGFNHNL